MRYCLSIDLDGRPVAPFSFDGLPIREFLQKEKSVQPAPHIALTVLTYEREKPGLLEQNWSRPWYDDDQYFLFLGGSVLYRNGKAPGERSAPTPKEALAILLEQGDRHYETLKGNYYLVLLRKADRSVEVWASPMSMHPAFASFSDHKLTFSNYLEAFHAQQALSIDTQGLVEFALFDHSIHDRTIYEGVRLIPGGHCFQFSTGGVRQRNAYDLASWYTPSPISRAEALDGINATLKTAINRYLDHADRLNIAFTGGFDGRLNFSFIPETEYPKVKAFSYGMPGSPQITIPSGIADHLGFRYEPVHFDTAFEKDYPKHGKNAILLTGGITGFNRGMYAYAYDQLAAFSRSCLIGQCDMIRPTYTNPAGVIFNPFSRSIFYGNYEEFLGHYRDFAARSFLDPALFTTQTAEAIYEAVRAQHIEPYSDLTPHLRYYFYLLKEGLMKYWHTEFHLADIFVDDYVSFADLDYLETLFGSAYAGIYKGLFAKSQLGRRYAHDLYVDLMTINNDRLNYFYNDRFLKPGWLKYGLAGQTLSAGGKQFAKIRDRLFGGKPTFNMEEWARAFYEENEDTITGKTSCFNAALIEAQLRQPISDSGPGYRFNRMISQKIWLEHLKVV